MKNQKKTSFPKKEIDSKKVSGTKKGYPLYPPSDDIYNRAVEEKELDPEDPSKTKAPNEAPGEMNEKGVDDILTGDDLDVPGAELDDVQEETGNEDEENNYYSLGGD